MERFDAVVIGSGFGGAIPALRLAEAQRKVLVLEKGRRPAPRELRFSWDPRYLQTLQRFYLTDDYLAFFQSAMTMGGGSVVYAGAMLRAPSEAFDFQDRDGQRLWPKGVDRAAMDPYYAKVEEAMQVRQARWDEVPKAGGVFAMLLSNLGLSCDRGRFPFVGCLQCGFCEAGCQFGRNQTLLRNYIPAAEQLGAQFRAGADARSIEPYDGGYRVLYRDAMGAAREAWGKVAVVAAGAIESAALLLRSAQALGGVSLHLGKHLSNNGDVAWYWMLPEGKFPPFELWRGRNNAVMITYAFWREHRLTIHTGCGPPALIGALDIRREAGAGSLAFGLEHKRLMSALYRGRMVGGIAIGLVHGDGEVQIDSRGNPKVLFPMTPELSAYTGRVMGVARSIAEANGAEVLAVVREGAPLGGAHQLSTCRMGDDPARSVVDAGGEVNGRPGLFVSDAGALPGGTGVNPALTVAANAERIAEQIIARHP